MPKERGETGRFVETVTPEDVLDVFEAVDGPPVVTSADIADATGLSRDSARRKLTSLHDQGRVGRRESAGRVLYWLVGWDSVDNRTETAVDTHSDERALMTEENSPVEPSVETAPEPDDGDQTVTSGDGWRDLLDDSDVYSHQNPTKRREQMLAAGSAALDLLCAADAPVSTERFNGLYERYPVEGQSPPGDAERASKETYWRKTLKPALDRARKAGLAKQNSGSWDWEWIGGDTMPTTGGIYDPSKES
jgi:hypothetical protein